VIKIFDKKKRSLIFDDAGFFGEIKKGKIITSQIFNDKAKINFDVGNLEIATHFSEVLREGINPFKFILLRILNLTFLKNVFVGNLIKKILIKRLITGKKKYRVALERKIILKEDKVKIDDILIKNKNIKFKWLEYGKKFSAIHMGSARYFQPFQLDKLEKPAQIDLDMFNKENKVVVKNLIEFV
jgi:hypothetical protein